MLQHFGCLVQMSFFFRKSPETSLFLSLLYMFTKHFIFICYSHDLTIAEESPCYKYRKLKASKVSLVGRRGYRAHLGNMLLIAVTRSEKYIHNGLLCQQVSKMSHVSLTLPILQVS